MTLISLLKSRAAIKNQPVKARMAGKLSGLASERSGMREGMNPGEKDPPLNAPTFGVN